MRRGRHMRADRKSTRLNSSHLVISYAVFCLKKKKNRIVMRGKTDSRTADCGCLSREAEPRTQPPSHLSSPRLVSLPRKHNRIFVFFFKDPPAPPLPPFPQPRPLPP